jgi:hypothetical protein
LPTFRQSRLATSAFWGRAAGSSVSNDRNALITHIHTLSVFLHHYPPADRIRLRRAHRGVISCRLTTAIGSRFRQAALSPLSLTSGSVHLPRCLFRVRLPKQTDPSGRQPTIGIRSPNSLRPPRRPGKLVGVFHGEAKEALK